MIPLTIEYGNTGASKIIGFIVFVLIVAGVIYWNRKKAKKITDSIKRKIGR